MSSKSYFIKISILIIYVDDIILIGDDEVCLVDLKKKIVCELQIKDLGTLKIFIRIEFVRSKKGTFVDQSSP